MVSMIWERMPVSEKSRELPFLAFFRGDGGIRTLDLSDANELKALICIDFQTFPALSAGM